MRRLKAKGCVSSFLSYILALIIFPVLSTGLITEPLFTLISCKIKGNANKHRLYVGNFWSTRVIFCLCKFPVLSLKYTEVPRQKAGGCRAEGCSGGGKRRWMDRRSIGVRDGRHSGSVRQSQTKQKR